MEPGRVREILEQVRQGKITTEEALETFKTLPYEDLSFANVDTHRHLRRGYAEVVFCKGKTPEEVTAIFKRLSASGSNVLGTRADERIAEAVRRELPEATYHVRCGALEFVHKPIEQKGRGVILIVSAGTSDIPVAEEAAVTARFMGNEVRTLFDVGVAGIHRLMSRMDVLRDASVIIVVAGMEGALASVVGGMVDVPVIAVPTSIGYGASFGGLAALLAMLNSCADGVTVVNIDNGYGAGYAASVINRIKAR